MKNPFLASLALAMVVAAPATAADLPFEAPPPLPAAYYDWSGAYVGFSAGGTHYNVTHHFPSPGAITPDVTTGDHDAIFGQHKIIDLFTAGARVGYAWDRLLVFVAGGFASAHIENAHCSTITGICDAPGPGNGVVSNNRGWYAGGGFDYMAHRGALVDVILGVEYQHFDVGAARAFCVNPGCVVPAVRDFDLSASGDIVRARLTVKTHGFGFGPPGGAGG